MAVAGGLELALGADVQFAATQLQKPLSRRAVAEKFVVGYSRRWIESHIA